MSLRARKKKGFSVQPGVYQAILIGVYDLGTQESERYKNESAKLCLIFELPDAETTMDTPVTLSKLYSNTLHEKASLRASVEALLNRSFTNEEAEDGIDLGTLLGANAQVEVVETESNGKTRTNIRNVIRLAPKTKKLKSYSEHAYYELDPKQDIPTGTPQWIEALIKKSKEFQATIEDEEPTPEYEEVLFEKTLPEAF